MAKSEITINTSDVLRNVTITVRVVKDWRWHVCYALICLAGWIGQFVVDRED